METEGQEAYLKEAKVKEILVRGVKKLLGEITSIKFLLLIYICFGIAKKFIGAEIGLGTALVLVGMREVPVDAILAKLGIKS
jgi:hypothetical protein